MRPDFSFVSLFPPRLGCGTMNPHTPPMFSGLATEGPVLSLDREFGGQLKGCPDSCILSHEISQGCVNSNNRRGNLLRKNVLGLAWWYRTPEGEAGRSLSVSGQPDLQSKF